jgi:hypothetical protein
VTPPDATAAHDLVENRIGVLLCLLVTIVVSVWIGSTGSDLKYALYALPGLMMLTCAMAMRWRVSVDRRAILAFIVYAGVAVVATLGNPYGSFATRDLLILTGSLLLFVIAVRAPTFVADACLGSLAVASAVVALTRGVGADFNFLASAGLLESPLAFPLGIVFLYFAGTRQWGRAAIAFILFFLAFKRIALAGALAVLAIEFALGLFSRRGIGRVVAVAIVVAASVVSLFLLQIFEFVAILLNNEEFSGNSISLGRSELASILWREIGSSGVTHQLLGFGPGAADNLINETIGESNPHNDWLKIAFDYGAVGFVALHVVLYLIHPPTPLGNRLYIYLAFVMCTDNVLIYVFYYVYLFLILRIAGTSRARSRPASPAWPSPRRDEALQ